MTTPAVSGPCRHAVINVDDPPQSSLNIAVEENKFALRWANTYGEGNPDAEGWSIHGPVSVMEKDVRIHLDFTTVPDSNELLNRYALFASGVDVIYSSQKGILLSEMTGPAQPLNTIVLAPEQISYLCRR